MAVPQILQNDQSYTFHSYFEMAFEPEDILANLGHTLSVERLSLPQTTHPIQWVDELQKRLERTLLVVSLTSEQARRETLVAPILLEVATHCQAQLRIEYPLAVSDWLKGTLDYLLRTPYTLVVVEAKNDDLTRGFTQLAAELIALAQVQKADYLYGAVTIGDAWRFGKLDTAAKHIIQDLTLFTVPDDLSQILCTLVGILEGESTATLTTEAS